jgi:hypothetical protein
MVNPHAIRVITPAISESARRFADLAGNANASASIDFAVLTGTEIGRALQAADVSRIADERSAASLEFKVGAATMIDPDAVAVVTPAISLTAR